VGGPINKKGPKGNSLCHPGGHIELRKQNRIVLPKDCQKKGKEKADTPLVLVKNPPREWSPKDKRPLLGKNKREAQPKVRLVLWVKGWFPQQKTFKGEVNNDLGRQGWVLNSTGRPNE